MMKQFPWLSLTLLLASYSTFSWFLYRATAPWVVWAAVFALAVIQALLLTTLSQGLRRFVRLWLQSDLGYFSMVAIGAFSIAVILVWFNIFGYFLMVVGSEILSRLDLQNAGFNSWQTLGILTMISSLGLAVGWIASYGGTVFPLPLP
jgi:hypothetical protein